MQNIRSIGVTIVAWLFMIGGLFGFMQSSLGLWLLFGRGAQRSSELSAALLGLTLLILCGSVLMYYIGFNILKLKEWARKGAICISVLAILLATISLFTGGYLNGILRILFFVIPIIVFSAKQVKEQFKQKEEKAAAVS